MTNEPSTFAPFATAAQEAAFEESMLELETMIAAVTKFTVANFRAHGCPPQYLDGRDEDSDHEPLEGRLPSSLFDTSDRRSDAARAASELAYLLDEDRAVAISPALAARQGLRSPAALASELYHAQRGLFVAVATGWWLNHALLDSIPTWVVHGFVTRPDGSDWHVYLLAEEVLS